MSPVESGEDAGVVVAAGVVDAAPRVTQRALTAERFKTLCEALEKEVDALLDKKLVAWDKVRALETPAANTRSQTAAAQTNNKEKLDEAHQEVANYEAKLAEKDKQLQSARVDLQRAQAAATRAVAEQAAGGRVLPAVTETPPTIGPGRIPILPVFGKGAGQEANARDFLLRCEMKLRAYGCTETCWPALVAASLADLDLVPHVSALVETAGSWAEFKAAFLQHVQPPHELEIVQDELHDFKLQPGESMREYADRFDRLAALLGPVDSPTNAKLFVKGLQSDPGFYMKVKEDTARMCYLNGRGPGLAELKRMTQLFASVVAPAVTPPPQPVVAHARWRRPPDGPRVSVAAVASGSGAGRGGRVRRPVVCYNCQEPGHVERNCPKPRRQAQTQTQMRARARSRDDNIGAIGMTGGLADDMANDVMDAGEQDGREWHEQVAALVSED